MTDTANLEDGFYWVRLRMSDPWEVAKCECGVFMRTDSYEDWCYEDFHEIDPRPIKREDVK